MTGSGWEEAIEMMRQGCRQRHECAGTSKKKHLKRASWAASSSFSFWATSSLCAASTRAACTGISVKALKLASCVGAGDGGRHGGWHGICVASLIMPVQVAGDHDMVAACMHGTPSDGACMA